MKRIILILLLISTFSCQKKNVCNYIENYYQKVYLAEEAYYKEDYQKVFDQMSQAEKSCEILNQSGIYEMLKYAESSAHIGKNDKAFHNLAFGVIYPSRWFLNSERLTHLFCF